MKSVKLTTTKMEPRTLDKGHEISGHTNEFLYEVWDRLVDADLERIKGVKQ